ncbi:ecotin family protein [Budvicia aquatica]|uniref:ecotin family protein n=1 Tax=Budvicia aquatica TaxID=82979 RepID=UPI0010693107
MACPDNTLRETFVEINNANRFERYNSKLPIVVFTPKDVEVRLPVFGPPVIPSNRLRLNNFSRRLIAYPGSETFSPG